MLLRKVDFDLDKEVVRINIAIAANVRYYMNLLDISAKEMAEFLNISVQQISKYLNYSKSKNSFSAAFLYLIARKFGISMSELFLDSAEDFMEEEIKDYRIKIVRENDCNRIVRLVEPRIK